MSYEYAIYSPEEQEFLKNNYNITPRKTFNIGPPNNLNKEQAGAYIIGFIDGDGSITIDGNSLRLRVCTSSEKLIRWIKEYIAKLIDKEHHVGFYFSEQKETYTISAFSSTAKKILSALDNINLNYKLNRKWRIYHEYCR